MARDETRKLSISNAICIIATRHSYSTLLLADHMLLVSGCAVGISRSSDALSLSFVSIGPCIATDPLDQTMLLKSFIFFWLIGLSPFFRWHCRNL